MAKLELGVDQEDLIRLFIKHNVEFVIVGGWAVVCHGYDRFTEDIDLYYRRTRENAARAYVALTAFFASRPPGLSGPDELLKNDCIQFGIKPNRIDIMNRIEGTTFEKALVKAIAFPGIKGCRVISFEALIENKKVAARDQDIADVKRLEKVRARRAASRRAKRKKR